MEMIFDSLTDPLEDEVALEDDILEVISLLSTPDESKGDETQEESSLQAIDDRTTMKIDSRQMHEYHLLGSRSLSASFRHADEMGVRSPSDLPAKLSMSSGLTEDNLNEPIYLRAEVSASSHTLPQPQNNFFQRYSFPPTSISLQVVPEQQATRIWQEYCTESMKSLFDSQQAIWHTNHAREKGSGNPTQMALNVPQLELTPYLPATYKKPQYKKREKRNRKMRPMSAYNLFFKEERARILGTAKKPAVGPTSQEEKRKRRKCPHNKISFAELGRIIGKRWKELSDEERSVFEEKARADKERYESEKLALVLKRNTAALPNISQSSA